MPNVLWKQDQTLANWTKKHPYKNDMDFRIIDESDPEAVRNMFIEKYPK